MKKLLTLALCSLLILALSACSNSNANNGGNNSTNSNNTSSDSNEGNDDNILKIGATPVPHKEILEFIKPTLQEKGIELEIIEFTDYVTPNLALNDGEIDANFFQHEPYLNTFCSERGLELVNAASIHVEPLGLYSKEIEDVSDLKEGDSIAVPNDPTNLGRSLILLENNGIITLKDDVGLEATTADIKDNPKKLKFTEIDAAQLPRVLDEVTCAIINTNYALEADLNPIEDSLLIEGSESPYSNIITTRPDNKEDEKIKTLIEVLQSDEVKEFINTEYNGAVVPAF